MFIDQFIYYSQAAKKIFNGKPSMAATGNLSHMPYLDQILK